MNSLRIQLILQIFLPLSLLAAALVWMSFNAVEDAVETRLEKEIELVARAMRGPVEQALLNDDRDRIRQSLGVVSEIGRVYGAFVYGADGGRVASAGESSPGWRQQVEAAEVAAQGEELGTYAQLGGEAVFSYFVPLTSATGRIEGLLQVVRQESEIAGRLEAIRVRGWWLLGGVVVLMFLILLIGHRLAVVRPVERLLKSMRRVEHGRTDHRARVEGPRELSNLAAGLNRMLDGIESMQFELERKRSENLSMTERMRRQESLAALGRFSSGVAHELGAPLSVIDGDARRLIDEHTLSGDGRRRLQRMRHQVERTRLLIRQLMEFVRSDRKNKQPVDLARLLRKVVAATRPQAEACAIRVESGALADGLIVPGFEIRLEHAITNLVRNAIQAATARVAVRAQPVVRGVEVSVEDDGPGVPNHQLKQIFEPFHSARPDGRGTGLGLAIVRTVADEHSGRVIVQSSKALGGSRFVLLLPGGADDD
jgi:signal transduction histidine kinase